jgi:hypothetical protein
VQAEIASSDNIARAICLRIHVGASLHRASKGYLSTGIPSESLRGIGLSPTQIASLKVFVLVFMAPKVQAKPEQFSTNPSGTSALWP